MPCEDIRSYFAQNAQRLRNVTVRTENALIRGGVTTMGELSEKSDLELSILRNMGEKSLALAIAMRDKYKSENCQSEHIVREESK